MALADRVRILRLISVYTEPLFVPTAKELVAGFEEDMTLYGVCSISEVYDGNPPYAPNGCISQAWSVGEIPS